eukprot:6325104-Amphidinium_carterae.1
MIGPQFSYKAGVVPGCKLATRLVTCLTLPLLLELKSSYESLYTVTLVDDWSLQVVGPETEVADTLLGATTTVVNWFLQHDLPLAADKCRVVANRVVVQKRLIQNLSPLGFSHATAARHLGGEVTGHLRRRCWLKHGRWRKAFARMKRSQRLRKAGAQICHLTRAGAISQAVWGSASNGTTGLQVRMLRSRALRTVRRVPLQAAVGWSYSAIPELITMDPATALHVRVLTCWFQ